MHLGSIGSICFSLISIDEQHIIFLILFEQHKKDNHVHPPSLF